MSETVLDRIAACLRTALTYNPNAQVPPVALLWPDEHRHWRPIIRRLGRVLPVVSLGEYDPQARRGPAYWVRCVVAGKIETDLPAGVPVVYLPGVPRSALRAVETCPPALRPIAELQYRSQWFSHPNNKDWSVRALLAHGDRGLGLDVADDAEANAALLLALDRLIDEPVDRLAKQRLDADYFRDLVNPDPVRGILGWLDDPRAYRERFDDAQWATFIQQCKADFGFDPTVDGEVVAAGRLGQREGVWGAVWGRFAETPELFPGIPAQLGKARPQELIIENRDAWPQDNENAEEQLRRGLRDFEALTTEGARAEATRLDAEHAWRRSTVWAALDLAPLAFAVEQLALLAELTAQPLASHDLASLTADYAERGWRADDAAVRALAAATESPDRDAVSAAVAAVYQPWVDHAAKALQAVIGPMANARTYKASPPAAARTGAVTVFVDGLRLDIADRVHERLVGAGLDVEAATGLSALPTVTQTAKPALAPVAGGALGPGPDLDSANAATGTKATIGVLRTLMGENGIQVLTPTETGDPSGAAWTEVGTIDHRGHDVGIGLVDHLDEEVERIAGRIRELIEAGWRRVDVLTDHGWLLLPGGMEKVDLPPATTVVKKGRCARLKDGATVETPTVPWFWDRDVRIAIAPGATCFEANKEYEHGGVSPQECIVPRLTVTAGAGSAVARVPEITKVRWLGLVCRVELAGVGDEVLVDLRALPADPATSIAEHAKETSGAGKVSLVVPDEEHEGENAYLVLVAPDGQIVAQRDVVVGRNR